MLDTKFCDFLEHELTRAFGNSTNERVKHFWCDGILLPDSEHEYSKKSINDKCQIITTAYMGVSGQDLYELTLKFGQKALSRYARDLDITECVPNPDNVDWFDVDIERKKIRIQLD